MNESRLAGSVYFLILALGILNLLNAYPLMPPLMASHFGANGTPNGWLNKEAFFLLTAVIIVVSAIPGFLAPRLIASQPDSRINLPKKAYWLAPERREETFRFMKAQMRWFSCSVLFVLLYGTSQAINANLPGGSFRSGGMFYLMVGFFGVTALWLMRFIRHFYNTTDSSSVSAPPRP